MTTVPSAVAAPAAQISEFEERALIGGLGLILSAAFAHQVVLAITFLTIATAGIAMINASGNLSGFTGSMITAVAKNLTGDINNGTYALGACLLVSCMLILLVPRSMLTRAAPADASKPSRHTAHAAQRASGSTLPMTER